MNRTIRALACATACVAAAGGATASAHPGEAHGDQRVTIRFAAVNGDAPVSCATPLTGLGTGGTTAVLTDLRFFVSNVRLTRANGTSVPLKLTSRPRWAATDGGQRTTLIDLENGKGGCTEGDGAVNAVVTGTVPKGRYTGVRYFIGVPFTMNHTDTVGAPAPLASAAMAWSWQAGRKFAKVEVSDPGGATGAWSAKTFFVHLGSSGCVGNPATGATTNCRASNRGAVRLPRFDPARQRIAFDVGALLAGNDITANRAGAPGCMSGGTDPECAAVFGALGIGWSPDGAGSGLPVAGQTTFRAIR
ncbi:MAG: MbnP family copper-binding protein [Thermoleophilia bacterium]